MAPSSRPTRWGRAAAEVLLSAAGFLVFASLDLLDVALCFLYGAADAVLEENPVPCCCCCREGDDGGRREGDHETSETLSGRRNVFRGIVGLPARAWRKRYLGGGGEKGRLRSPRWSDCCCRECVAWVGEGDEKLHFVVKEASPPAGIYIS